MPCFREPSALSSGRKYDSHKILSLFCLFLWRDFQLLRQHKIIAICSILAPILFVLLICITRWIQPPVNIPTCELPGMPLPSRGLLVMAQFLLCLPKNLCGYSPQLLFTKINFSQLPFSQPLRNNFLRQIFCGKKNNDYLTPLVTLDKIVKNIGIASPEQCSRVFETYLAGNPSIAIETLQIHMFHFIVDNINEGSHNAFNESSLPISAMDKDVNEFHDFMQTITLTGLLNKCEQIISQQQQQQQQQFHVILVTFCQRFSVSSTNGQKEVFQELQAMDNFLGKCYKPIKQRLIQSKMSESAISNLMFRKLFWGSVKISPPNQLVIQTKAAHSWIANEFYESPFDTLRADFDLLGNQRDHFGLDQRFYAYGFLSLQEIISGWMIDYKTKGNLQKSLPNGIEVKPFPKACDSRDYFNDKYSDVISMILTWGNFFLSIFMVRFFHQRKQSNFEPTLHYHRIPSIIYESVDLILFFSCFFIFSSIQICLLQFSGAMNFLLNFEIIFVAFFFFFLAIFVYSRLLATFTSFQIAAQFNSFHIICFLFTLYVAIFVLDQIFYLYPEIPIARLIPAVLFCLIPQIAFGKILRYHFLFQWQDNLLNWNNLFRSPLPRDYMNAGFAFIALLTSILLAIIINKIFNFFYDLHNNHHHQNPNHDHSNRPFNARHLIEVMNNLQILETDRRQSWHKLLKSSNRKRSIYNKFPPLQEANPSIIKIQNLSINHHHHKQSEFLNEINLTLFKGELTMIFGLEESGVQLLIQIILGLIKPDEGSIHQGTAFLESLNPRDRTTSTTSAGSGGVDGGNNILIQEVAVAAIFTTSPYKFLNPNKKYLTNFTLTVWQHLVFYGILNGLDLLTVKRNAQEYLNHVDFIVKGANKMCMLTWSQLYIVDVISALLTSKSLVLLQNPPPNMNPHHRQIVFRLLKKECENRGVLVISYSAESIETLTDRLIILDRGVVIADDSIANVRKFYAPQIYLIVYFDFSATISSSGSCSSTSRGNYNNNIRLDLDAKMQYFIKQYLPDCSVLLMAEYSSVYALPHDHNLMDNLLNLATFLFHLYNSTNSLNVQHYFLYQRNMEEICIEALMQSSQYVKESTRQYLMDNITNCHVQPRSPNLSNFFIPFNEIHQRAQALHEEFHSKWTNILATSTKIHQSSSSSSISIFKIFFHIFYARLNRFFFEIWPCHVHLIIPLLFIVIGQIFYFDNLPSSEWRLDPKSQIFNIPQLLTTNQKYSIFILRKNLTFLQQQQHVFDWIATEPRLCVDKVAECENSAPCATQKRDGNLLQATTTTATRILSENVAQLVNANHVSSIARWVLNYQPQELENNQLPIKYLFGAIEGVGGGGSSQAATPSTIIWFPLQIEFSPSILLHDLFNQFLSKDEEITLENYPFPHSTRSIISEHMNELFYSHIRTNCTLFVALTWLAISFVLVGSYSCQLKKNTKTLTSSSASSSTDFSSLQICQISCSFLCDLIVSLLLSSMLLFLTTVTNLPKLTDETILCSLLIIFLYISLLLAHARLLQSLKIIKDNSFLTFLWFFAFHTGTGLISTMFIFYLKYFPISVYNFQAIHHSLRYSFLLFPSFCCFHGLVHARIFDFFLLLNHHKSPSTSARQWLHTNDNGEYLPTSVFDWDYCGLHLLSLLIHWIVLILILIIILINLFYRQRHRQQFIHKLANFFPLNFHYQQQHQQQINCILQFQEVSVRNKLHKINLEVNRGDWIAIVGLAGSGKSTLLNCILGQENVSRGSIELCPTTWIVHQPENNQMIVNETLTVSDTLSHFADFSGLHGEVKEIEIQWAIFALSLHPFLKHSLSSCSLTVQRKVHLAVTLMKSTTCRMDYDNEGDKRTLFLLDCPFRGMTMDDRILAWEYILSKYQPPPRTTTTTTMTMANNYNKRTRDSCTIVMTCDDMDDYDLLPSRICFIHQGKLEFNKSISEFAQVLNNKYSLLLRNGNCIPINGLSVEECNENVKTVIKNKLKTICKDLVILDEGNNHLRCWFVIVPDYLPKLIGMIHNWYENATINDHHLSAVTPHAFFWLINQINCLPSDL